MEKRRIMGESGAEGYFAPGLCVLSLCFSCHEGQPVSRILSHYCFQVSIISLFFVCFTATQP